MRTLWTKYCAILTVLTATTLSHGKNLFSTRSTLIEDIRELPLNLTRSHDGDLIVVKDLTDCDDNICMEMSTSTAVKFRKSKHSKNDHQQAREQCKCQCLNHIRTFREDMRICVNDIGECSLIPFVSSSIAIDTAERIPFVFLPLKGQIIYPSKELQFTNEFENMNCVVVGGHLMTSNGWAEMRHLFNSGDIPFRIFADETRRFLQWTGEANIRTMLQGRLVKVNLACRVEGPHMRNLNTSPCIAFRVVGTPIKTTSNVTEVQFALESGSTHENLSSNEYTVIAITSFCLGLMYIASVFLYIYLKKKKDQPSTATSQELNKNFTHDDSPDFPNLRSSYRRNSSLGPSMEFIENPEPHVVKSNPLMKHFMSFNENGGFMSDSSDAESVTFHDDNFSKNVDGGRLISPINSDSECCLPEEDVSITEDNQSDKFNQQASDSRQFNSGTVRRKLYFNPAYFEPSLLASPPPAAIEFLSKIREVISIAKNKMASKRYQPSLNYIPEEEAIYNHETIKSKSSAVSSSKRASSKDCTGCPGCDAAAIAGKKNNSSPTDLQARNCKNCGDKRKTIQKWLENVSSATSDSNSDTSSIKTKKKPLISLPIMEDDREELIRSDDLLKMADDDTVPVPIAKGFVKEKNIFIRRDQKKFKDDEPDHTGSIPKIISHSLKKNIRDMFYTQNFVRDKVSVFESKKTSESTTPTSPLSPKSSSNSFEANEIYNNPKFNIDTSEVSGPRETSTRTAPYSTVNKAAKKSSSIVGEVLDQYSNPVKKSLDKPLNQFPDMIYEAIEMEKKNSKPVISYPIPTPDYSSEYEMTKFKNYDPVTFVPFVPTPDYHTYGKNTLRSFKQYQPDSPIYSRKSPAYLVVDYETDSLERLNTLKRSHTPVSTPTSRSDFSSQPSPSSALPMEEEVEIRNAIYDRQEGFRKDSDTIKKEREIDIQMRKTKIKYNTPNKGSMTIELEGVSPEDSDGMSSTDSDQFEPDTLDRHSRINKTVLEKVRVDRKPSIEKECGEMTDEMGRLMTLETRHSRRQRPKGFASLEKLPDQPKRIIKHVNPPPDVISSIKTPSSMKDEIYGGKKGKVIAREVEHEYKKSQISLPIENEIANRKIMANNKSLRGDFLKMDLLKLDTNFHENQLRRNEFQPSLIKTVYHVEIPTPPKLDYEDSNKKSKDLKNAWRRFMGIAGNSLENNPRANSANSNRDGKVKDMIKRLNVVQGEVGKYDSGYLSSESITNDASLEVIPKPPPLPLDNFGTSKTSPKSRPSVPPPPIPAFPPPSLVKHNNNYLNHDDLVNINIYSSDDEPQSSIADESEDDGGLLDDGTESGTESWKFFKT